MSDRHVTAEELRRFVEGRSLGFSAGRFEAHVSSCDACAAALTGEARLELAIEELVPRETVPRPDRRHAAAIAAAFAMAASLALLIHPASTTKAHVHSSIFEARSSTASWTAVDGGEATSGWVASADAGGLAHPGHALDLSSPAD